MSSSLQIITDVASEMDAAIAIDFGLVSPVATLADGLPLYVVNVGTPGNPANINLTADTPFFAQAAVYLQGNGSTITGSADTIASFLGGGSAMIASDLN